ncbi:hypothetical protein [Fredinandcohnia quinoae]|uniref:Uncharacterized protein n=1 Tax=Fredinandcohnia quinoae TaxID=2918902 RepID=A0AAW5E9A7_9BACI|nr:hypothetical protein [Fredinandcohnia sp. SECRCQ15]MCH1625976.1 hypothetical protein [Fredinandcohnia sp. SECRCQ15]
MIELSFAQNFSLIALNAQDSNRLTNAKKVALRCMAAATILELYLNNDFKKQGEILSFEKKSLDNSSLALYQETVLKALLGRSDAINGTLPNLLLKVTKLSSRILKEIEHSFTVTLKVIDMMEEIPALIGCDLEFVTAGISVKEYRSNAEVFIKVAEGFRADILEDGPLTDETIMMLYLMKESGCVFDLFSKEELKRVAERINELLEHHSLAKLIVEVTIHKTLEAAAKNFLKMKKAAIATPTGSGLNFTFPIIERSQSVFIDTEAWFSNKEDRLRDVKARLEEKGHSFTVIREGDVPLIKIDNILYEAVPDAKQYRLTVHGVRLRKYPLSL